MRGDRKNDPHFANATFEFLKKALRANKTDDDFQPRGPVVFNYGKWEYTTIEKGTSPVSEAMKKLFSRVTWFSSMTKLVPF
jgi:hypothetical protein